MREPRAERATSAKASVAAAAARLIGMISSLLALPAISRAGGADALTVFLLATTLPNLLPAGDLGLGGALQTQTALWSADPTDQTRHDALARMLGSFLLVSSVAAAIAAVAAGLGLLLGAGSIVLGSVSHLPDAGISAFTAIAVFSATVPLQMGVRTLAGLQRVTFPQLAGAAGSAAFLAGALFAATSTHSPLPFVAAWGFSQVLTSLLNTGAAVRGLKSNALPRPRKPARSELRSTISSARWWVIIAVCAAVSYQLDAFIVARYVSPDAAGQYSLGIKLLAALQAVLLAGGGALWSRATVMGDRRAYRSLDTNTRRTALLYFGAAVAGVAVLEAVGGVLFSLLSNNSVRCNRWIFLAQGVVTVLIVGLAPFGLALAGVGVVRKQALAMIWMTVANLSISLILVRLIGAIGPAIGSIIAQLLFFGFPLAVMWKHAIVDRSKATPDALSG